MDSKKLFLMIVFSIFGGLICASCSKPIYEEAECQFDEGGMDFECGYLSVPENRAIKDSPMIQLHVAILRSKNSKKASDPVIILQGGPGGYALDSMDYWMAILNYLRSERDLIIFDQRGVGYSKPSLNCSEAEERWYQGWTQNLNKETADQGYIQALVACHDRLAASGVDLTAYTSAANAADVDDLRRALGYSKVNLYGSSYGTRLALTVMRDYPKSLRSVILDSVYPPQVDLFSALPVNGERSFDLLFERCAAEPACSQSYPDLESVFYNLVKRLNEEPLIFRVRRESTMQTYDVVFNGDRLIQTFFNIFYMTSAIPGLPGMIYELQNDNISKLMEVMGGIIFFNDLWSEGMYYSIQCSEEAPFGSPEMMEQASDRVLPPLWSALHEKNYFQMCASWQRQDIAVIENQAVVSDIPTLILSGEFDPITPPAWGKLTAETLSRSQFIEFPGVSHGVLGNGSDRGTCSRQIVKDFLADPDSMVDPSCRAELKLVFEE